LLGSGISDERKLLYVFLKYIIQINSNATLWRRSGLLKSEILSCLKLNKKERTHR
jgi:hypothetical protein